MSNTEQARWYILHTYYAKYLAEKQFFSIRPGNITIIPPGIRHCPNGLQNMTQPFKRILFCINPALMEKIISTGPYYEKHKALFSHARHFHTLGTPYEKLGKYLQHIKEEKNYCTMVSLKIKNRENKNKIK